MGIILIIFIIAGIVGIALAVPVGCLILGLAQKAINKAMVRATEILASQRKDVDIEELDKIIVLLGTKKDASSIDMVRRLRDWRMKAA